MKKSMLVVFLLCCSLFMVFSGGQKEDTSVLIYSSAEEFINSFLFEELQKEFPDYAITIEYMPSGNQAAKVYAEGRKIANDISYNLDYGYLDKIKKFYAVLDYDTSIFTDDLIDPQNRIIPHVRNGGCIAINPTLLAAKGLPEPTSFADLIDPMYKGLVSMPHPKSSGTGYMFVKALVNAWGEEKAFIYFDKLAKNILQFTSSGSGPVNALVHGEAAIGLGMIGQTVQEINNGVNLKIVFFEEGAPYSRYGMGIIEGKETRKSVVDVFDYMVQVLLPKERALYYPEKIYKEKNFIIENYPNNIFYADMSNDTGAEKTRLLEKWKY